MKNNKGMSYIILGIIFVLFNILAFVIPTDFTATFWIAYGFSILAFALQMLSWEFTFRSDDPIKSKFLGIPIVHVGTIYLVIQLIAFSIFKLFHAIPTWITIIACSLILGISAIFMIGTVAGRNIIENTEAHVKQKVFYIQSLQVDVEMLAESENDPTVKSELNKLAESIRFSDPMSSEELFDIENSIKNKIALLKESTDKQPLIKEVKLLLIERNKKTKILK